MNAAASIGIATALIEIMDCTQSTDRKRVQRRWVACWAVVALALGLSSAYSCAMTAPSTVTYEGQEIPLHSYMQEQFVRTEVMHRALIAGDFERVRAEARWIVERPEAEGLPGSWKPFLKRMKTAGTAVAQATTTRSMAHGVGSLGVVCGDCHTSLKVNAVLTSDPPAISSEPRQHMLRHQWGTDQLWNGLVAADDKVWFSGAEVFQDVSLDTIDATEGQRSDPHLLDLEDKVHRLGQEALRTYDSPARVELFAKLVSTCATCHHAARPGLTSVGR